jgi:hypothetical protein
MDPKALRVRLALVDFDGPRAQSAAALEPIDHAFLEHHLAPIWQAVGAMVRWCNELR